MKANPNPNPNPNPWQSPIPTSFSNYHQTASLRSTAKSAPIYAVIISILNTDYYDQSAVHSCSGSRHVQSATVNTDLSTWHGFCLISKPLSSFHIAQKRMIQQHMHCISRIGMCALCLPSSFHALSNCCVKTCMIFCFHTSSLACLHTFWHAIPTSFNFLSFFWG